MNITHLEKLTITDDIRTVMAKYVRHADSKNFTELANLFTENGIFTPLDVNGETLVQMAGRREIENKISESVGNATAIHHLFSFEIDIESKEMVHAVFSMEDHLIRPENEENILLKDSNVPVFRTLHGFGHYHGDFVKIKDTWFIKKLIQTRLKLDFTY
ncbi:MULTISPECIES: nuclear transport factor 2 family protein [Chryseobacterium]|uniref:nuclear transport factor 2 family protein n=1 Tax=Chryseobacterium TaxID=59732 RepID=UPI0015527FC2|nr:MULTISPECIES: nuclear transport factor 2 family protein [unclassified Chryseobacterium]MDC8104762.1 nuclear transport factor 2 family protein [Chryseobacterium sp. B21-037]MDQ1806296.1 nuclear transport factor 2 family protein [Chryseobacterium sp. CKR4-1]WBV58261.1 nuclear transport factor 2 family protein [Chryseobacterium daecheongense]